MHRRLRKLLRTVAGVDPDYFDMFEQPDEALFARLYVERIVRAARDAGIIPPARVLEAGCQAGRLVIPLAQRGFRVTGVDTSGFALRRARRHAASAGVQAEFFRGDVVRVLQRHPDRRFDLVICAEVVYLARDPQALLRALASAVRPGGLLCVSHRPKFFYLFEALRQYDLKTAREVLRRDEGPFRDAAYYNWQTDEQLRALYQRLGLQVVALAPIDRLAWMSGGRPSRWPADEQARWLRAELSLPGGSGTGARYALVIARRGET
jgi:SAM-dependent methyltransferase